MKDSYHAFARDHLQLGESLVCPVRVIYRQYQNYCKLWGFEALEARYFVNLLKDEDGVKLKDTKSAGRLRRLATGIGFNYAGVRERQAG